MTFDVCFAFFNKLLIWKKLYVKLKDGMSNSIDPDETGHYEPSHLDLCCLQKPNIACGSEIFKGIIAAYSRQNPWQKIVWFFLLYSQ